MGGLDQKKEEIRDTRGIHWLTDFVDDVRYAFRSLRRTPGLTVVVVVTIALGIGMTTTPYSMLDALVFRPYPVPRPGEIVTLVEHDARRRVRRFLLSRVPGHPRPREELRRRHRQFARQLRGIQRGSRRDAAGQGRHAGLRQLLSSARRGADARPGLSRGGGRGPGPRRRDGARARLLETRDGRRSVRRRKDGPAERNRLHRDRRGSRVLPGDADLLPPRLLHPPRHGAALLVRCEEGLLRGPRRQEAELEGAVEAGDVARSGARGADPAGEGLRAALPAALPGSQRGGADAVADAHAGRRRQLEVRRRLHDAGRGGAPGGVHERRRAAPEPRAHAPARDRRAARDRGGALPAGPAAPDREPGPRVPGRATRDRRRLRRHPVPSDFQHSGGAPGDRPVPDGRARARGGHRHVGRQRPLLRPCAGASVDARGPRRRAQVGRGRRGRRNAAASASGAGTPSSWRRSRCP